MTFLAPLAWAGLGISAVVAALYFLKKRPQPFEVSALFLWPQATSKSRSAWRWYKAPIGLLLLQLLVLILMVSSLAQPVVFTQAQSAGQLAIVLDTSASMQTKTENGTRLSDAIERAKALINDNPNAEFTLIEARQNGGVVVPLTSDHKQMRDALDQMEATYLGEASVASVLQWVQSQDNWDTFDRAVWFSDHLPLESDWQDFAIEFDLIEDGIGNAAITAFTIRLQPDVTLGYEAFVKIENYSTAELDTLLTLSSFGHQISQAPIKVASGQDVSFTFSLAQGIEKHLSVGFDLNDGLAFDNQRHFTFDDEFQPRVYWLGEPDAFLQQAFRVMGVDDILPWEDGTALESNDLLVVHDTVYDAPVAGNVLLLNSSWRGFLEAETVYDVQRVRALDLTHPVLQGITPDNIAVLQAKAGLLPETLYPLLEADNLFGDQVPLLGVHQSEDARVAWLGFSLDATNLRLTVDFPILVARLLRWLVPVPLEANVLDTGSTLHLEQEGMTVMLPSRETTTVERTAFLGTDEPGFYLVPETDTAWAVNVPANESRLIPTSAVIRSDVAGNIQAEVNEVANPIWIYFAVIGLFALGIEWVSYERGWL